MTTTFSFSYLDVTYDLDEVVEDYNLGDENTCDQYFYKLTTYPFIVCLVAQFYNDHFNTKQSASIDDGLVVSVWGVTDHRLDGITVQIDHHLQVGDETYNFTPYSITLKSESPAEANVDLSQIDVSLLPESFSPYLVDPPQEKTYELTSDERKLRFIWGDPKSELPIEDEIITEVIIDKIVVGECEDTCIAEYGKARNKLVLYASDDIFEKYSYLITRETVSKEVSSYLES